MRRDNDIPYDSLISIFYGLALSSGIPKAIEMYSTSTPKMYLLFALSTFLIGICDWFIYIISTQDMPYRNLIRIVMDVTFPIGIYAMFSQINHPYHYLIIMFLYFLFALVYAIVLKLEGQKGKCLIFTSIIPIICLLAYYYSDWFKSRDYGSYVIVYISILPWICYVIIMVNKKLKNT